MPLHHHGGRSVGIVLSVMEKILIGMLEDTLGHCTAMNNNNG